MITFAITSNISTTVPAAEVLARVSGLKEIPASIKEAVEQFLPSIGFDLCWSTGEIRWEYTYTSRVYYSAGRPGNRVVRSSTSYPTTLAGRVAVARQCHDYSSQIRGFEPAEGMMEVTGGDAHYEYRRLCPVEPGREITLGLLRRALDSFAKKVEELRVAEEAARKEFGHRLTTELRSLGLDRKAVRAYWGMNWRQEWTPAQFAEAIESGRRNPQAVRLALVAWAGWQLEELGWKPSTFPRSKDLVEGVASALGLMPATEREIKTHFAEIRRYGMDVPRPNAGPGCWRF